MATSKIKSLTKNDAVHLLELIHACALCNDKEEFHAIIAGLGSFFPHDYALCAFADIDEEGKIKAQEIINISYPYEWLAEYVQRKYHLIDPIQKGHYSKLKFELQYYGDLLRKYGCARSLFSLSHDCGIVDGYSHGVKNLSGTKGSIFGFVGRRMRRDRRTETILELTVPHMHQAFERVLNKKAENRRPLSARELEVLKWIKKGKSSWDISVILGISERTVKYHVANIMTKLDATSRTHAVAIAIAQELIDSDLE